MLSLYIAGDAHRQEPAQLHQGRGEGHHTHRQPLQPRQGQQRCGGHPHSPPRHPAPAAVSAAHGAGPGDAGEIPGDRALCPTSDRWVDREIRVLRVHVSKVWIYNFRPAYLSIFDCICTEIRRQYGCVHVFLKIRTKSFQKVWKSRHEQMQVRFQ